MGWIGHRPARAREAGLGHAGDGDGVGLVAAEDVDGIVVLTDGEADKATRAAFEDQDSTGDPRQGGGRLSGPVCAVALSGEQSKSRPLTHNCHTRYKIADRRESRLGEEIV